MKTQTLATLVGLGTLAIGSVAPADVIVFVAEGNITDLSDPANITRGATTWSWTYWFDSDAPDQVPGDPQFGVYALTSWQLTLGALTVSSEGDEIQVLDDFLGLDTYEVGSQMSQPAGWAGFEVFFELATTDLSTIGSDALPLTPPRPADFEIGYFSLFGETDNHDILFVTGDVKSIEIAPVGGICLWDLDANGSVGVSDLLSLLGSWGPCPPKGDCPADFDTSGDVGVKDLLVLLGNWGPCP